MKKILKLLLITVEVTILFIAVGAVITSITKNIMVTVLIEQFKSRATLDEEHSTPNQKLYIIESDEVIPTVQQIGKDHYYPGSLGDILVSRTSELQIPFVHEIVSAFAGGHAALILGDYSDVETRTNEMMTLESSGLSSGGNTADVFRKESYWADNSPYQEVIGLRVKMTEQERRRVLVEAMGLVGDPYNYAFIWDTKDKSYCSDIVAKAFSSIGVNLNKDGFTTSIYDLIVTNETYISYYHYMDSNGVKHIYYLG